MPRRHQHLHHAAHQDQIPQDTWLSEKLILCHPAGEVASAAHLALLTELDMMTIGIDDE